jgi:hypothetical protein
MSILILKMRGAGCQLVLNINRSNPLIIEGRRRDVKHDLNDVILIVFVVMFCGLVTYMAIKDWETEKFINEARSIVYAQEGR